MQNNAREKIIARVSPRFFDEGFSRVTTEELARDLGISKKTLYKYFKTKDELVHAVVRRQLSTIEKELLAVFNDESHTFLERITVQMRIAIRISTTLGTPFLSDVARYAPDTWDEIKRFRQEKVFSRMEGLLRTGQTEGMIRPEADPALIVLIIETVADNLITPEKLALVDRSAREVIRHMGLLVSQGVFTEKGQESIGVFRILDEDGEKVMGRAIALTPGLSVVAVLVLLSFGGCTESFSGVRGSGSIEATRITISARTQGELLSVNFSEGSRVEQGARLAVVDPTDIELQLTQAESRLERSEAQLDLLIAGARSEDIRQAEALLNQAQNAYDLAEKSYERVQSLFESGSATSSDLDQVETEYQQAGSRVASARAQLEKLESITRPQEIRSARAQVDEASAGVERLRRRLEETSITAPRSGTITTQAREVGEYISPGMPLFVLADLSTVYLTIYVPEPSLATIQLGQEALIFVDGLPERSFTGRVTRIAEEAEFTPKNVQTADARAQLVFAVEITIENDEGVFKIGMPADAVLARE